MSIIAFNKTKIYGEVKKPILGKINISNNVSISDVSSHKVTMGKNTEEALSIKFDFFTKYLLDDKSEGAIVEVSGEVIYLAPKDNIDSYVEQFKKNKKMPKEVMMPVLNLVLTKCNIEALKMSEQFNLPPPVPLPKVDLEKKTQNYIG